MDDVFENLKSDAELKEAAEVKPESTPKVEEVKTEVAAEEQKSEPTPKVEEEKVEEEISAEQQASDTPWGKPSYVPKMLRERLKKLTERDREKEAKIRDLETAMGKFIEATGANKVVEPTLKDFLAAGKTENDFINFLVDQKVAERTKVETQRLSQQEALQRTEKEAKDLWDSAIAKVKDDLPDYDDVVSNADNILIPTSSLNYIKKSDIGPYVSYTIATSEDIQKRLDSMKTPAEKHAVIVEVEKNLRAFLKDRKPLETAPVQPQTNSANTKPKVPKQLSNGRLAKALDPATASIEDWLGI